MVEKSKKKRKGKVALEKRNVVLKRLEVTYLPVDALKPNDYNPNRQSEHDFELLLRSIEDDGFTQPIVVHGPSKTIIDGEHRWRACKALGYDEVPVVLTDMTPEQMRIATLRHNRARGSEDAGLASEVLRELISLGTMKWAQDALMLDDVELRRLTETMRAEDVDELVQGDVPDDLLGARGTGLSEFDKEHGVDTAADQFRAKERIVAGVRADEEEAMSAQDRSNYRLVLYFAGEEATLISEALGKDPPGRVLEMCREAASRET